MDNSVIRCDEIIESYNEEMLMLTRTTKQPVKCKISIFY